MSSRSSTFSELASCQSDRTLHGMIGMVFCGVNGSLAGFVKASCLVSVDESVMSH